MIILSNNGKKIEFKIVEKPNQTTDRRGWIIKVPTIICTSRTDADKIQELVNNFIYNLSHELLGLEPKVTLKQAQLADMVEITNEEKPKTTKTKEN